MRKRILIPVGVVTAVAIIVGSVLVVGGGTAPAGEAPATATAKVGDLTRTETLNGVVAYQDLRGLSSPRSGIITWLPPVGQDVAPGQVLMSVDAQPVVLLDGPMPAWRELRSGVPDGPDVQQLESSLLALGYGGKDADYPDAHWDRETTEAVIAFQKKVGAAADGVLSLGEVVFTAGAVHIAKLDGHVGGLSSPDTSVLTVQSTERLVTLEVDPVKRDLVPQGAPVNVQLPSGETITGKIASVSTTLVQNADGKPVYAVSVTLDDPSQVADIALAPVTVHYVATVATQVLAVPVSAIIGVPGGGYAVNAMAANGGTKRVSVELGAWGDGYVQVTGDITAGTKVEVPT
jgi:peptidoglycan hydrolase-like protein with peptidoglycan-binding domain